MSPPFRAIEMYSRSVTPTPSLNNDQEEVRNDQGVGGYYSLTNVCTNDPGSSVKYFNYPSNNFLPAKSLAQEMLDAEGAEIESENIYDESSKLLGDDNLDQ